MNLIAASDLHISKRRPQYRCDNYFGNVCLKFKQLVFLCNTHNAPLVVAGDFFDSHNVGHEVFNVIMKIIRGLKTKLYLVAGQHDQLNHLKNLESTALRSLFFDRRVFLLDPNKEVRISNGGISYNLFGCSFGQVPKEKVPTNSILVIHKSITEYDPPFYLPDAISAKDASSLYSGYDLIISGDYHIPFTKGNVVNCGPMMRTKTNQTKLRPSAWLIDLEQGTVIRKRLRVQPAKEVFSLVAKKNEGEGKLAVELDALIAALKEKANTPNYEQNTRLLMDKNKTAPNIREKVKQIFDKVRND